MTACKLMLFVNVISPEMARFGSFRPDYLIATRRARLGKPGPTWRLLLLCHTKRSYLAKLRRKKWKDKSGRGAGGEKGEDKRRSVEERGEMRRREEEEELW